MSIVQEGPRRAAGAYDQADRDAGDHALSVGSSGRGSVSSRLSFWSAAGTNSTWDPLASVLERREVSMAQKPNFTDKYARDRQEAERLDLEVHAPLESR